MNRSVTRREFLRLMGASGITAWAAVPLASSAIGLSSPPGLGRLDPDRYGIIILVDGLRADLFSEMLEKNELPNIKRYLVDRGVSAECVGTLPSTTGPAHLPFLTGTLPGRNNVTGIRWVDRESRICRDYCAGIQGVMINKDYGMEAPTIFEILEDEETAAIYAIVNKGATYIERPGMKEAWWASREEWKPFDAMAVRLVEELYAKRTPRFTFVWMPGVDHLAHFEGSTSEEVREAVIAVDKHVGTIVDVLKNSGIYDKTLLGLVADHGLRDTMQNGDLAGDLEKLGLEVKGRLDTRGDWAKIHRYNAVVAVSGNAFAHIYLCDDPGRLGTASTHGWSWEPKKQLRSPFSHGWRWESWISHEVIRDFPISQNRKIDVVDALLAQESVELLLTTEEGGKCFLSSSSGRAVIQREFMGYVSPVVRYRYSVEAGDDPLGYAEEPDTAALMADGKFHSGDEWLKASWSGIHPDAIVQISQIFDSPRCGDIVVLAKPGWDLMDEKHIASHGSMERAEIVVPVLLAGPGIVNKKLNYARTVDVFPTCLRFFGLNPESLPMDGRTLDIFA